ncbi:MAG: hypothetical protein QOK30_382, partial [Nocardioidaceae bacterium]|nr:hypothetical protein [Nocardioidaceae bacterium]
DPARESPLAARIDRAAGELAGLMHSTASEPAPGPYAPAPDPYDDPVPFESLLAAQKRHL